MDDEIIKMWLNYVKAHITILEPAVAQAECNMLKVREYMSCIGAELTPKELQDFTALLRDTIEYIRCSEDNRTKNI